VRKLLALTSLALALAFSANAGPILTACPCAKSNPLTPEGTTNVAPVWNIPDRSIQDGSSCAYDLLSVNTDADGDARTFSLVSGALPTGCSVSGTTITGTISGTGTFNFVLGANDGRATILRPAFTSAAISAFNSDAFTPAQNERFTVTFSVTPVASNVDYVIGFGEVTATGYGQMLATVRFGVSGNVDARNNNGYAAVNTLPYSGGNAYDVQMTFNVPAGTYSVTVNDTVIASDYVFRGAARPTTLGYITSVDGATPGVVGSITGPVSLIQPVNAAVTWTVFSGADVTPPNAPDAPTLVGVTETEVSMTLPTSGAGDHNHYDVYRSPAGCSAFALETANVTSSSYTSTGLEADTDYCFRLIDVDNAGNSSTAGSTLTASTSAIDVNDLLSIQNVSTTEGNSSTKSLTFTLTASSSQAFNIACSYQTSAGSADSATDFVAGSGTATITAGNTTTPIAITINGDTTQETDETFTLRVFNCGVGGVTVNPVEFTATGTITNDDVTAGTSVLYSRTLGATTYNIEFTVSCTGGCGIITFADGWSKGVYPITEGGTVTVSAITPNATGSGASLRNGAMIDPNVNNQQGFSGYTAGGVLGTYTAGLTITLPYVTTPASVGRPQVIVKADSGPDGECDNDDGDGLPKRRCFDYIETLTILEENPGNVFRPPYYGTDKPLIPATDFDDSFLSSLTTTTGSMSWDEALETFRSVWVQPFMRTGRDHEGMAARVNQQTDGPTPGYDADVTTQYGGALVKLTQVATGADVAKKTQLAKYVAQMGIDLHYISVAPTANTSQTGGAGAGCMPWYSNGGYNGGRLVPIIMGAYLLNQTSWITRLDTLFSTHNGRGCFPETAWIQKNPSNLGKGVPTWGGLDSTPYNVSCTGTNPTCASGGGSSNGAVSGYDGLSDGDANCGPFTSDTTCYPPSYLTISTGAMWGGFMTLILTPHVSSNLPANVKYWWAWYDRVKRAGDSSGANSIGYYDNVSNNNIRIGSLSSQMSSGASQLWAAYKDCYADYSCTGMGAP
jgi:hypothetical protein